MSSPTNNSSATTSPSKPSTSSTPLTDISPNTTSPRKQVNASEPTKANTTISKIFYPSTTTTTSTTKDEMPTTRSEQAATYISPSDAMLSPATKKLSQIKGRRFAGAKTSGLNPKALFQKSLARDKENQAAVEKGDGL